MADIGKATALRVAKQSGRRVQMPFQYMVDETIAEDGLILESDSRKHRRSAHRDHAGTEFGFLGIQGALVQTLLLIHDETIIFYRRDGIRHSREIFRETVWMVELRCS